MPFHPRKSNQSLKLFHGRGGRETIGMLRFRDKDLAVKVTKKINEVNPGFHIKIMHFCGTHEYTVSSYGIRSMLPNNVELVSGPGCPVCVASTHDIDSAIKLAEEREVVIATFGDIVRVPSTRKSLWQVKAEGSDVRVVYSPIDAVRIAEQDREREVVFFAVGFETTAPAVAYSILKNNLTNFAVLTSLRLTPPILRYLLEERKARIDGIIAPGHVSTIIGSKPWQFVAEKNIPVVVAGFEPLDVLLGIYLIIKQIRTGEARLENEYVRSVKPNGNERALRIIEEVFCVDECDWRGIGVVPRSSYQIKGKYSYLDAISKYGLKRKTGGSEMPPGCSCDKVVLGEIYPDQCPLFKRKCKPESPLGPCMVSLEGTCFIWYKFGERPRLTNLKK